MVQSKEGSIFAELWRRFIVDPATPRWAVAAASFLLIFTVTAARIAHPEPARLELDRIAVKDYEAPFSTIYIDSEATEEARRRAAEEVPPVYSIDTAVNSRMILDLGNFFLAVEDNAARIANAQSSPAGREGLETAAVNFLKRELEKYLQIQRYFVQPLTDEDFAELLEADQNTRDLVREVVDSALRERIVGLIFESDLPEALDSLAKAVQEKAESAGLSESKARIARLLAGYFIRPNAAMDQAATALARQQARDATPVVQKEVRQGQIFLRKGELITQEDMDILKALGMVEDEKAQYSWANVILFAVILLGAFIFGAIYLPGPSLPQLKDARYFTLLFTVVTVCYLSSFFLIEGLSYSFQGPELTIMLTLAALPVISASVLLVHYFSRMVASTVSGFLGVALTLAAGEPAVLLPALFPSLVAALMIRRDGSRWQYLKAITVIPFVWAACVLAQALSAGHDLAFLKTYPWALLYGFLPVPIAMLFANIVLDGLFNIPTANRLREFDTPDHPLLRRLQLEASGTWHHSMMVGLIAEAACQALGGNTLLVRVACMYHDIGKVKRPEFFVENQFGGRNIHDKYSPALSKLIIENHVKDGIVMARAHGLPQEIIDIIPQHHGTSVITYFFRKALAISEDGYVSEFDYRYPGPKPQTLEAACINLADACESAVRALEEPTPHRIESLVHRIFEERLLDGQYDECGLALNQLDTIKKVITERLVGAYHARIEYPEEEELRKQLQLKRAEQGEEPVRARDIRKQEE